MEVLPDIKTIPKQTHGVFDFFINKIEEEISKTYVEEFLGLPQMPLIGHYNGNDYSLGSVLSLICFQIKVCQGEKNNETISPYSGFNLPKNIEEYLCINEELSISNNTKNKKLENIFYPKNNLNFKLLGLKAKLPFFKCKLEYSFLKSLIDILNLSFSK